MSKFKCPYCKSEHFDILEIHEGNLTKVECSICKSKHEIKTEDTKLKLHHRDN